MWVLLAEGLAGGATRLKLAVADALIDGEAKVRGIGLGDRWGSIFIFYVHGQAILWSLQEKN